MKQKKEIGKKQYFNDKRMSKEDVQLLFKLKTKMLDCKSTLLNQYGNVVSGRICKDADSIEDEDHLLICNELNTEIYDVPFSDVFADVDKHYKVTQVFKKVLRKRNILPSI